MPEFDQARIAETVTAMLSESHGIAATADGGIVSLPQLSLKIVVEEPIWHQDGQMVQIPIAVGDPGWAAPAWDQAVGIASEHEHPVGQALMGWTHNVLPLFIALRLPDHPLTEVVYREDARNADGSKAEILAGPMMTRRLGKLPKRFDEALAVRPPTLRVVDRLLERFTVSPDPIWVYTLSGRANREPTAEVVVNNARLTDRFPGFDDHLRWGRGSGTVKSWAVVRPVPS
ncbi:hypothetical protein [Actinocrispum sp. NPDC049592]|uniref:hypothetical protein n=1 Tax=Actinocrispum sp. NPDC049592 TaxID=3154835 RepID=UPI00342DB47E